MTDTAPALATKEGNYGLIRARHVLVIIGFLGLTNVYLLRVNLNVAIVAMVVSEERQENQTSDECPSDDFVNGTLQEKKGEFHWSSTEQGIALGSFFYCYIITSFFGGTLAEKIGGKLVFGFSILMTALLTLLTPIAARTSLWALVALRIAEGAFEGMSWPSMHTLCGHWLPKSERGFLYSVIHTGAEFGTVIGYPIAGTLCGSDILGGWPAAFYIFGAMGIVWFGFWWFLISETPSQHPRISQAEKLYILSNLETHTGPKNSSPTPWLKILTSVPLWSVAFTSFFTHWAFEFIFVDLSSFLDKVLHFNLKTNGALSSLPHICHVLVQWSGGYMADFIGRKEYCSRTATRKIMNLFSCLVTSACFLGAIFANCDRYTVIALIVIGTGAQGLNVPSFNVALLDMAPDYAGTLMGLANGFGNIASFMAPYVAGALTENGQTLENWHFAFYIASGVCFLGGITFTVFGSSELQPWAKPVHQQEVFAMKRSYGDEKDNQIECSTKF